ncbi:MAG TPA: MarR family transcriptional regulator [Acidimicrobiales bacterium]|nr:MarR family transcriptional regulator [Acidimicrobiales bacterium]
MAQVSAKAELEAPELASRLRLTIARLGRRVRQEGAARDEDLTPSRLAALTTLDETGPLTLGQLAALEQVSSPSMTRIVARLEELGLAEREMSSTDRRVVRVRITDRGSALLAATRSRRDLFLARRVQRLTSDERATLARALPVMDKLLED